MTASDPAETKANYTFRHTERRRVFYETVGSIQSYQNNMTDNVVNNDRGEKRKNFVYSVLIGQEVLVTVCSFAEYGS